MRLERNTAKGTKKELSAHPMSPQVATRWSISPPPSTCVTDKTGLILEFLLSANVRREMLQRITHRRSQMRPHHRRFQFQAVQRH